MPAVDDAMPKKLAELEALAENAYDGMSETSYPVGHDADLRDYFSAAIGLAEEAGFTQHADRLRKRLNHCNQVYRSQLAGP